MNAGELPDYLFISYLNAFQYCTRRFWIECVDAEMETNAYVLEGELLHEHVHDAGTEQDGDEVVMRRAYIWSDRLRIAGFADLIAERDGVLYPVEYKRGRLGKWVNDDVQLCAQALCLEERTGRPVPRGALYYHGSRRRQELTFDDALRSTTEATIAAMWGLLEAGKRPRPIDHPAKCRDCSLEPICLPREVLLLAAGGGEAGVGDAGQRASAPPRRSGGRRTHR